MLTITNEDNMELMARYSDNHFDLAIVDPPYGININNNMGRRKGDKHSGHKKIKWDNETPSKYYFDELFRISKNQIIWGGNYFDLPLTGAWLFWDKLIADGMSFSQGELAWMSFGNTLRKVTILQNGSFGQGNDFIKKIHPTPKPIKLYKWILDKYAKEGDKILDTHLGSGSIAIACHDYKFDLTACELDKDYFYAAMKRINNHMSQTKLF